MNVGMDEPYICFLQNCPQFIMFSLFSLHLKAAITDFPFSSPYFSDIFERIYQALEFILKFKLIYTIQWYKLSFQRKIFKEINIKCYNFFIFLSQLKMKIFYDFPPKLFFVIPQKILSKFQMLLILRHIIIFTEVSIIINNALQ